MPRPVVPTLRPFPVLDDETPGTRSGCLDVKLVLTGKHGKSVVVAANRVGAAKKGEIPKADFAKGIERPVDFVVPFDPKSHIAAAVSGKPLPVVAKRGTSVVAMKSMVESIDGREQRKSAGLFSRKPKKDKKEK